jgi:hypothetical protein
MTLAQLSPYGEGEEDLYLRHPLHDAPCAPSTLDHPDQQGVQKACFWSRGSAAFSTNTNTTGSSGVLIRNHDGRTVQKRFYQQVLQSSYNSGQGAAAVPLRHSHVVNVLRRLVNVEAGRHTTAFCGSHGGQRGPLPDVVHTLTPADRETIALQIHEAPHFAEAHKIAHGDLAAQERPGPIGDPRLREVIAGCWKHDLCAVRRRGLGVKFRV